MTGYHIAALALALGLAAACIFSNHCADASMSKIMDLAGYVAIGVLGNAGASGLRKLKPRKHRASDSKNNARKVEP